MTDSPNKIDCIRYTAPDRIPSEVLEAAAEIGFYISRTPTMIDGWPKLLLYYQQQIICHNYHRYGNLKERALKKESVSLQNGWPQNAPLRVHKLF
jgi:RHH-type proline utilization regulon transcriptional repressor/proline dehydrogenase/delta 1-pyrroline-5-carboxylate dehydrogenase